MLLSPLLALSAFVQQLPPGDWRPLVENDQAILTWNAADVRRDNASTFVSIMVRRKREGSDVAYAITKVEIDCPGSRARVVETANYMTDGSRGWVDTEHFDLSPIAAGTPFQDLHAAACTRG